jgi:hypothetical protein
MFKYTKELEAAAFGLIASLGHTVIGFMLPITRRPDPAAGSHNGLKTSLENEGRLWPPLGIPSLRID